MANCQMAHSGVSRLLRHACFAALIASAGCASSAPESSVGGARLALKATASSGAQYRLREGVFTITGAENTTVSSDDYLSQQDIVLELPAGEYEAQLEEGWFLEKFAIAAWIEVPAQLTSVNPAPFTIAAHETTDLALSFKAGDDIIDMERGHVKISLAVDDGPGPQPDHCSIACAEAADHASCKNQTFCEWICRDLPNVFPAQCEDIGNRYTACASTEPGSTYVCHLDYPVAGACEAIFEEFAACIDVP
jgi:hypothetical protein